MNMNFNELLTISIMLLGKIPSKITNTDKLANTVNSTPEISFNVPKILSSPVPNIAFPYILNK